MKFWIVHTSVWQLEIYRHSIDSRNARSNSPLFLHPIVRGGVVKWFGVVRQGSFRSLAKSAQSSPEKKPSTRSNIAWTTLIFIVEFFGGFDKAQLGCPVHQFNLIAFRPRQ